MGVRVEKAFYAPAWDAETRARAIDFWEGRGIRFERAENRLLVGRRGSLWGNLTSFDMGRLLSTLTVAVGADGQVEATLEMETFESYVLTGDPLTERWTIFRANCRRAAWAWSLSGGVRGDAVPPDERP